MVEETSFFGIFETLEDSRDNRRKKWMWKVTCIDIGFIYKVPVCYILNWEILEVIKWIKDVLFF